MNSSVLASSAHNCLDVSTVPLSPYRGGVLFLFDWKILCQSRSWSKISRSSLIGTVFMQPVAVSAKLPSRDRHLSGDLEKRVGPQFSVIVPVLNEAPLIRPFLQHLRERAPGAEI